MGSRRFISSIWLESGRFYMIHFMLEFIEEDLGDGLKAPAAFIKSAKNGKRLTPRCFKQGEVLWEIDCMKRDLDKVARKSKKSFQNWADKNIPGAKERRDRFRALQNARNS